MKIEVPSNKQAYICECVVSGCNVIETIPVWYQICSLYCCVLLGIVIKHSSQVEISLRISAVRTLRDLWPTAAAYCPAFGSAVPEKVAAVLISHCLIFLIIHYKCGGSLHWFSSILIAPLLENKKTTNSNLSLYHNQQIFSCSFIDFFFLFWWLVIFWYLVYEIHNTEDYWHCAACQGLKSFIKEWKKTWNTEATETTWGCESKIICFLRASNSCFTDFFLTHKYDLIA